VSDLNERRALIANLQRAIGSFLWLGNNLHNIKASPDKFREFYEAALEDARPAYRMAELALKRDEADDEAAAT
jgi:hypothetical protein